MFWGRDKEKLVAVFDIASASVGALLFRHQNNQLVEIISCGRWSVIFPEEKKFSDTWRIIKPKINLAMEQIKKDCPDKIDLTVCFFSSPWYVAQTRMIKVQRDQSFKVSELLVNRVIEEEKENFKKGWRGSILKEGKETVFFESGVLKTVLNGYDVKKEKAFEKKVSNLEIYAYLSLAPDLIKKKIEEELAGHFSFGSFYFHTFPFALFNVLKHIMNTEEGLLFLDMTGDITDVFVFREETIEEMGSFPKGENFLIKKTAKILKLEPEEARARIYQYRRGELEGNYEIKVAKALTAAVDEWASYLKRMLAEMTKEKFLPQKIYLAGPLAALKEVSAVISREDFGRFTIFNKPFDARVLSPDSLKYHFDFPRGFQGSKDIFLLIFSLFANSYYCF